MKLAKLSVHRSSWNLDSARFSKFSVSSRCFDYHQMSRIKCKKVKLKILTNVNSTLPSNVTEDINWCLKCEFLCNTCFFLFSPLKPGDEGFINRARVPQPSNKTYLVRPKWKVPDASGRYGDDEDEDRDEDGEERPSTSTSTPQRQRRGPSSIASSLASGNRLERHIKAISRTAAVKKKQRFARAVKMSIEGRNMSM